MSSELAHLSCTGAGALQPGAFRICTASSARSRCGDVVRNDGWRGRQRSGRRQRYHTEKQRNGGRTENGLLRLCLRCSVSLCDTVASVFTVHSRPRAGTVPSRAQRHRDRRRPTQPAHSRGEFRMCTASSRPEPTRAEPGRNPAEIPGFRAWLYKSGMLPSPRAMSTADV